MGRCNRVTSMAFLLLAGAFCVHQLRYVLAFGEQADAALLDHGHGYLSLAGPTVGLVTALLLARWLRRLASIGATTARVARWRKMWPAASTAMLAIYTSQELL